MQALKEMRCESDNQAARIIALPVEPDKERLIKAAAPLPAANRETIHEEVPASLTRLHRYTPFLGVALNSLLAVLLIFGWYWQQHNQPHTPSIAVQPASQPVSWNNNNKWMRYDWQLNLNRPPSWISKQLVETGVWKNYSWRLTHVELNPVPIKATVSAFSVKIRQVELQDVAVAIGPESQLFVWLDMALSTMPYKTAPLLSPTPIEAAWQVVVLDAHLSAVPARGKSQPAQRTAVVQSGLNQSIVPVQQVRVHKTPSVLTPTEQASSAYQIAFGLYQQGRVIDAEATLRDALVLAPDHIKVRTLAVQLMIEQGRLNEARELLLTGIKLAPQHYPYVQSLAHLLVGQGQIEWALQQMEAAQHLATEDSNYLALLAWLYQRNDRHVEAARVYIDSLALNPEQGQWWLGLAISLQAQQDWQGAVEAYEYALAMGLEPGLRQYAIGRRQQLMAM